MNDMHHCGTKQIIAGGGAIGRDARGLRIGGNGEASAVGKAALADPLRIASPIPSAPRLPAGSQQCAVLLVC